MMNNCPCIAKTIPSYCYVIGFHKFFLFPLNFFFPEESTTLQEVEYTTKEIYVKIQGLVNSSGSRFFSVVHFHRISFTNNSTETLSNIISDLKNLLYSITIAHVLIYEPSQPQGSAPFFFRQRGKFFSHFSLVKTP